MTKTMFRFKHVVLSAMIIASGLVATNCSDDDKKSSGIDINDPDEVSKSLTIENATFINGTPPSPSTSETAPLLDESDDGEDLFSIQGSKVIVNAYVESGTASGFYVQVEGAEGYYKVAATQATKRQRATNSKHKHKVGFGNARTKEDDGSVSFSIEVPENIKPGEFCVSYCVYDAQNQVSNIVTQCITVTELGGSGSSFISKNSWSFFTDEEYENGSLVETEQVGVNEEYEWEDNIWCDDSLTNVTITEVDRTDYAYYTFAANGAFHGEAKGYEKYYDWESSECEVEYIEETYENTVDGGWSYDEDTQTLTIIYNIEYEEDGQTYVETYVEQGEVELVGNNLVFTTEESFEGEVYKYVTTFKPKP